MEENENVVEETTQEQTIDESKFESAGDDSVIKIDLSQPMRYLFATNPKLAKKFVKKTSKSKMKNLPEKKSKVFKMKNPLLKK